MHCLTCGDTRSSSPRKQFCEKFEVRNGTFELLTDLSKSYRVLARQRTMNNGGYAHLQDLEMRGYYFGALRHHYLISLVFQGQSGDREGGVLAEVRSDAVAMLC